MNGIEYRYPGRLRAAAAVIADGGVIACPTESVYGLSCDPWNAEAVALLLSLKHRSWRKGLIVVAAAREQLLPYIDLSAEQQQRLRPAAITWLVPASPAVPPWICGEHSQIAVRVSPHPTLQALCMRAGPLVSTSANPTGMAPAMTSQRVRAYFGKAVRNVVPGLLGGLAGPTEIRDIVSGKVLRSVPV